MFSIVFGLKVEHTRPPPRPPRSYILPHYIRIRLFLGWTQNAGCKHAAKSRSNMNISGQTVMTHTSAQMASCGTIKSRVHCDSTGIVLIGPRMNIWWQQFWLNNSKLCREDDWQKVESVWLWGVKMVVWHTVCACACDCVYVAIMVSHWDDTNCIPLVLSNPFTISVCISVCSALCFTSPRTFSPLPHPSPSKFLRLSLKCKHITTGMFFYSGRRSRHCIANALQPVIEYF